MKGSVYSVAEWKTLLILTLLGRMRLKRFELQGVSPPDPRRGALPLDPAGDEALTLATCSPGLNSRVYPCTIQHNTMEGRGSCIGLRTLLGLKTRYPQNHQCNSIEIYRLRFNSRNVENKLSASNCSKRKIRLIAIVHNLILKVFWRYMNNKILKITPESDLINWNYCKTCFT